MLHTVSSRGPPRPPGNSFSNVSQNAGCGRLQSPGTNLGGIGVGPAPPPPPVPVEPVPLEPVPLEPVPLEPVPLEPGPPEPEPRPESGAFCVLEQATSSAKATVATSRDLLFLSTGAS